MPGQTEMIRIEGLKRYMAPARALLLRWTASTFPY